MNYVFDLDGTLSDARHRLHHIQGETKDWDAFYAAAKDDPPIEPVVRLAGELLARGHILYIVTGRSDQVRLDTLDWLDRHGLLTAQTFLNMRKQGDYRPDHEIKREWHEKRGHLHGISMVFEDRARVVKMWRELGLCVAQVDEGGF